MTRISEIKIMAAGLALMGIAAGIACHLWGVQSDPCAAGPMERAHCRTMEDGK